MEDNRIKEFCVKLQRTYISESFYSVWKPQAKNSIWILNVPAD